MTRYGYKKDFNNKDFADYYIKKHKKLIEKMGHDYAKKLAFEGFKRGKVLDAGSGFGGMDIVLAKRIPGCEITGIDLSDPFLDYSNSRVLNSNLGNRVKFIKADVHNIPFEDNTFDVAFSVSMVHLVKEPIIMLNEIERVLKPNGYLFIKDLRRSWLGILEREIKSAFSLNEAKKLIAQSKLKEGRFSKSVLWWNFDIC